MHCSFLRLLFAAITAVTLAGCNSKDPVVIKAKGITLRTSYIDTLFREIVDSSSRNEQIKNYLQAKTDNQLIYNSAIELGFLKSDTNKKILDNIAMVEVANYYANEVLVKNWGFLPSDVHSRFMRDRKDFIKKKPFVNDSLNPTETEKRALAEWENDPCLPLETVRNTVLRRMLLEKDEIRTELNSFVRDEMNEAMDSAKLIAKEDALIKSHTLNIVENTYRKIKTKRAVTLFDWKPVISEADLFAEWERTKRQYLRRPDLYVKHIEVNSSNNLKVILQELAMDTGIFDDLQKKYSINAYTSGKTVTIKNNQPLSWLKGETKHIYQTIVNTPIGKISSPIHIAYGRGNMSINLFKICGYEQDAIMTYEECKEQVLQNLTIRRHFEIPDSATLAVIDGKKKIRAGDLFTLLYKNNPLVIERFRSEEGRKNLLENYYLRFILFYDLAKEAGLLSDKILRSKIEQQKRNYIIADFREINMNTYFGLEPNKVLGYYNDHPDSFCLPEINTRLTYEEAKNEIINNMLVTNDMVRYYWEFNAEEFFDSVGNIMPFDDVKATVRKVVLSKEKSKRVSDIIIALRKRYGLKISLPEYDFSLENDPRFLFNKSAKLAEQGEKDKALEILFNIRYRYPTVQFQPDICLSIAQLMLERGQHFFALKEYMRFLRLYGSAREDSYKAQFMIGYIYSDRIKDTAKAIIAYDALVRKYPQSDLADDAQLMIKMLKNGAEFKIGEGIK